MACKCNLSHQSQFLMGIGEAIICRASKTAAAPGARQGRTAAQAPGTRAGMGESFHVLVTTKGLAPSRLKD